MKTVIFNSGLGKEMDDSTPDHHKSQEVLKNGETISERQIDFDNQPIFSGKDAIKHIPDILSHNRVKKPMIVCGFYDKLIIRDYLDSLGYDFTVFSGYSPNPTYDQVLRGVELFREAECDSIISIGGGSAMDTAKNIKLFSVMDKDSDVPYIKREYGFSPIKHLAIPTTSGTGSESTRFSIVYYQGEKFSVKQDCILPDYVILCSELISTVSDFQKKCTMMDAISQCIEAIWNVNTNALCRDYAVRGLRLALDNIDGYLAGDDESLHNMQLAANYSGKAINISQTTAGHAMSYKLSSLYGIPHGYAVALCLIEVWRYMVDSKDADSNELLSTAFEIIDNAMGVDSPYLAIAAYEHILFDVLGLEKIALRDEKDIDELTKAVNIARLANNPVALDVDDIKCIYKKIFA